MRLLQRRTFTAALAGAGLALAWSPFAQAQAGKKLVIGFAQTGAESEWRTANTDSVKAAAKAAGHEVKFSDAQQKQENQIKAIRSFITQKVDVIILAPLVTTGWDTVLKEAKAAKIPVILESRNVVVKDPTTWTTFIGSDFVEEGRRAAKWLLDNTKSTTGPSQHRRAPGTVGSDPAIDRKKGFDEVIEDEPALQGHPLPDRRLHARQRQGSDGGLPEGRGQKNQRALCAQRRHGHRRDPGHRGGGPQARQGHPRHRRRRREGRFRSHDRGQDERQRGVQSAAGAAADGGGGEGGRGPAAGALDQDHRGCIPRRNRGQGVPNRKY